MIFHLLLDIPDVPWLWPFIPLESYDSYFDSWIYTILHNPLIISTEIIGLIGILVIIISYKILFNWQNTYCFLFKTPNH